MKKRIAILIIIILISLALGFLLAKGIIPKISEDSNNEIVNNNVVEDPMTNSAEENNESNWKDKFKEIIKGYQETEDALYTLSDIEKDNVPELIIRTGASEAEYMYHFYSFKDNTLGMIGEIGAGHTLLYEMNDEKYIIAVYAHMGYETVSNISIVDNKIKYEEVSRSEVAVNTEYTEGDKVLELYEVSNLEIIDNYSK